MPASSWLMGRTQAEVDGLGKLPRCQPRTERRADKEVQEVKGTTFEDVFKLWFKKWRVDKPKPHRVTREVQMRSESAQPRPARRLASKKLPQSVGLPGTDLNRTPDLLDDISFLRLPEVKALTGLSKTSIYELIRGRDFPAPVRLGPRAVAWVKSEIRQWAIDRVHASRSAA